MRKINPLHLVEYSVSEDNAVLPNIPPFASSLNSTHFPLLQITPLSDFPPFTEIKDLLGCQQGSDFELRFCHVGPSKRMSFLEYSPLYAFGVSVKHLEGQMLSDEGENGQPGKKVREPSSAIQTDRYRHILG